MRMFRNVLAAKILEDSSPDGLDSGPAKNIRAKRRIIGVNNKVRSGLFGERVNTTYASRHTSVKSVSSISGRPWPVRTAASGCFRNYKNRNVHVLHSDRWSFDGESNS